MASDGTTTEKTVDVVALAAEVRIGFSKLKRRLRDEAGAAELTPSQASAVGRLEKLGTTTVTELAAAEGVRPQSMGATVATLQSAGYIVSEPDPADGRRTLLALSPMAFERFSANRAAREGWLFSAIQASLTEHERYELARGFAVLNKLIDS